MNSTDSTQPSHFPYRGILYSIAPHWILPNRHLVLPNGIVLVVREWSGRVPVALADIRRSNEGMPVQDIVQQLDGVLAEESTPALGESLEPMAVLDFQDMRYAVPIEGIWGGKAIELPDGQLVTTHSFTEETPTRIVRVNILDRIGSEATTIISQSGAYLLMRGVHIWALDDCG